LSQLPNRYHQTRINTSVQRDEWGLIAATDMLEGTDALKNDVAYCDPGAVVSAVKFCRCRFVDHVPILVKHAHKFAWVWIPDLAKRYQNIGSNVANGIGRLGAFQSVLASEPNVSAIRFVKCQSFEN
jgi:hypothetical protein